jgi:hypothetical protein
MTRTASLPIALPFALGLAASLGVAGAEPAAGQTPPGYTTSRCQVLDGAALDVDVLRSGVRLTYAGDRYDTCDEAVVVTSHASAGPAVDNHADPVLAQVAVQVSALEAAGAAGVHVPLVLDPCWAGLQVHRDGDTLVWDDVVGDGCELTVETDFAGDGSATEIHVVQQTGNIRPPHVFQHDADEVTVLTGLPDGTWYVKVHEGAVVGTTMAVDGAAPAEVTTVHGVADGSTVEIHHPAPLGLAAHAPAPSLARVKSWSGGAA